MASVRKLRSKVDALYQEGVKLKHQETIAVQSARHNWSTFASSALGIATFFVAGIFKDSLLNQPKQYARLKSKRLVKLILIRGVRKVFYQ